MSHRAKAMAQRRWLLCAVAAVLLGSAAAAAAAAPAAGSTESPKQAYVSLLYSDSFLLGLRVLGQSLRESGTTR